MLSSTETLRNKNKVACRVMVSGFRTVSEALHLASWQVKIFTSLYYGGSNTKIVKITSKINLTPCAIIKKVKIK